MKKKNGFTLIELIAVMCISAILGAIVISLFASSNKMIIRASKDNIMQDEARVILDAVDNDLRVGKNISTGSSGSISFYIELEKDSKIYRYEKIGTSIQKVEMISGISKLISEPSNNIDEFKVEKMASGKQYKINLKLKNGSEEYEISSVVTPRNS